MVSNPQAANALMIAGNTASDKPLSYATCLKHRELEDIHATTSTVHTMLSGTSGSDSKEQTP